MKRWILVLGLLLSATAYASPELVQIVSFEWDGEKLKFVSLGSGTAVGPNLILTNKHVVRERQKPMDFLLICPAQGKSSRPVECSIPAAVTAVHPKFDAALIRPLSRDVFFPYVRTASADPRVGDRIRVEGFPLPVGGLQNFGSTKTCKTIQRWEKAGGELSASGDKLTITRGKVKRIAMLQSTGELYFLSDVKVNFGNSGGAAFDDSGSFVGIPTLRDRNFNALILAYSQLREWVEENRDDFPYVAPRVMSFYEQHRKKRPSLAQSLTANTFDTKKLSRKGSFRRFPRFPAKRGRKISARLAKRISSRVRRPFSRRFTRSQK